MKNRKRNRMQGYDYSKNNIYFVTSCVKNMECCFGDVVPVGTGRDLSVHIKDDCDLPMHVQDDCDLPLHLNARMELNQYGLIAHNQLQWLENQYEYVVLHEYIVMPNHIHVVIEIDSQLLRKDNEQSIQEEVIKIKSLSQLIGAYKTTSSKLIREAGHEDFAWHRSFHDHIIRDEKAYNTIVNYIASNPSKWNEDSFNKR